MRILSRERRNTRSVRDGVPYRGGMTRTTVTPTRGFVARVKATRGRVRATRAGWIAWRVGVSVLGAAVIVIGIVLLPLPGPGWLIIFAGLGLLATEFEWASRLLRFARAKVSVWTKWVAGQGRGMQVLIGLAGFVALAAVVAGAWTLFSR